MAGTATTQIINYGDGDYCAEVTCIGSAVDGSFPASLLIVVPIGVVTRVVTVPDGTTAPTSLYDIALVDGHGLSVATLTDRSATVAEQVLPTQQFMDGHLFLTITNNSVNSGKFVIYIYGGR